MGTSSDFNEKNPSGVLSNTTDLLERGEKISRNILRQSLNELENDKEQLKTLESILIARQGISDKLKEINILKESGKKIEGEDKKALDAYIDSLYKQYELQKESVNKALENLEITEETLEYIKTKNIEEENSQARKNKLLAQRLELEKDIKYIKEEIDELEKKSKDKSLSSLERKNAKEKLEEKSSELTSKRKSLGATNIALEKLDSDSAGKVLSGTSFGKMFDLFKGEGASEDLFNSLTDKMGGSVGDAMEDIGLGEVSGKLSIAIEVAKVAIEALNQLRQSMVKSVNEAVSNIKGYYGTIQANLNGSMYGTDAYKNIAEDVEKAFGFSRVVKQTDYLNQIASLSNQGLVNDIEQRALLETIKDKTLTSFNVANAGLTRLVRLNEQDSVQYFGIQYSLKKLLNNPLFGDSSYLNSLFDSVANTLVDVTVASKGDITEFNSVVQTWLGAMYSSGLSDSVVSSIASGINALGSGNVSALASDESIQRLFLLSMDRAGLDYADILQQGLSAADTNTLLSSIVSYLSEISDNTNDNLVLKSSYSSLFNLSTTDMQAIRNLNDITSSLSFVNQTQAYTNTQKAVYSDLLQNTHIAEKWDTLFENFSYSFGSNIAENDALYNIWKIADITYNLLDSFGNDGAIGKVTGALKLAPALTQLAIGGTSFIDMLGSVSSIEADNGALLELLGSTNKYASLSSGESYFRVTSGESFKSLKSKDSRYNVDVDTVSNQLSKWEDTAEDTDAVDILKEMSKTLMKLDKNKYAFAVSLQGMSDEVLKSFASIFADEDSMMATFSGDNKVLEDALFSYLDDTTSNSTEAKN